MSSLFTLGIQTRVIHKCVDAKYTQAKIFPLIFREDKYSHNGSETASVSYLPDDLSGNPLDAKACNTILRNE